MVTFVVMFSMLSWLNLKPRRLALFVVLSSAAGVVTCLLWTATSRSDINFLLTLPGADWIIYPKPPSGGIHRHLELHTTFRKSFILDQNPGAASLSVCGFHNYSVSLNGQALKRPVEAKTNWKTPIKFSVSDCLRAGTNQIVVTVSNTNGPAALWFLLRAGNFTLRSDETWQTSYVGSPWSSARLATSPATIYPGSPLYRNDEPRFAIQKRWPILLLFVAISAVICLVTGKAKEVEVRKAPSTFKEWLPVIAFAGIWIVLFANNLPVLPVLTGYDVGGHLEYIDWIQERHVLPLASDGWEMFQPPLYHALCAALLELTSLTIREPSGIMLLRIFGLMTGIVHFVIVWQSLRLLFHVDRPKQYWGLILAASLPPLIFLSQYVGNEGFAATLVSGCVYLCLRILKSECPSWKLFIGLGFCLGAALLAKSTAVLAVPPILGAIVWKVIARRERGVQRAAIRHRRVSPEDLGQLITLIALCLLVSGWHYARVWRQFGNPFIGVWDPKTGFLWWQDDGFRTSTFYFRFGQALFHPWFGALKSFGDGIYSTLWGDGLVGGLDFHGPPPPWNYDLMAIGYWLALIPTLALLVGGFLALRHFLSKPTPEWFLMLGLGFLAAFATTYLSMVVPYFCTVKAFYALPSLIPFCAIGAWGFHRVARVNFNTRYSATNEWAIPSRLDADSTRRHKYIAKLRHLAALGFCVLAGAWSINAYSSFWIVHNSNTTQLARAKSLIREKHPDEAAKLLSRRLASPIENSIVRYDMTIALGEALIILGLPEEGFSQFQLAARLEPAKARPHFLLGNAFHANGSSSNAIAEYNEALRLEPDFADALNDLAWIRATSPDRLSRDGEAAVQLAERACQVAEYKEPMFVGTLAAAYAEAGRFEEAVKTATQARDLASAAGQQELIEKNEELLKLFTSQQPYHQPLK